MLADLRQQNADAAAEVLIDAALEVNTATAGRSSRVGSGARSDAPTLGEDTGAIHSAGLSPGQASPATILKVDLYVAARVLRRFGNAGVDGCQLVETPRLTLIIPQNGRP